jgi:hypothetical protein
MLFFQFRNYYLRHLKLLDTEKSFLHERYFIFWFVWYTLGVSGRLDGFFFVGGRSAQKAKLQVIELEPESV